MTKILSIIILFICGHISAQNPKYHTSFHIIKLYVDSNQIHWTTTEESGPLPFQIEQHLCGTWKKVGEVMGKGTADTNAYSMKINFHNGENYFRVLQWGSESGPRLSRPVTFKAYLSDINYAIEPGKIKFSRETFYQLSKEETVVKTSYGLDIDILSLTKGEYKLCFDTITRIIKIK